MTPATGPLAHWLAGSGGRGLCIVSPHLDDAVYSAFAMLRVPQACVATVVTVGDPSATSWAEVTGFADVEAEFAARRAEDLAALGTLGVRHLHLGARGGDAADIAAALDTLLATQPPATTAYLLPAGAGRHLSKPSRWLRRLLRRPSGAPPHADHVQVRDHLLARLRGDAQGRFAFYAEVPYVWSDSVPRLQRELEACCGLPLVPCATAPDPEAKYAAAMTYASQAAPILGRREAWRRRVLGIPETFYLPAVTSSDRRP